MKESRKWSVKQLAAHGFSVGYYGGYYVDLKIPKGLSREDHYAYADQKMAYINSLSGFMKKRLK